MDVAQACILDGDEISIAMEQGHIKAFEFDRVFGPDASQGSIKRYNC